MSQTFPTEIVVRLRGEGASIILTVPKGVREQLCWKTGDIVCVRAVDGNLLARKVPMDPVIAAIARNGPRGGE